MANCFHLFSFVTRTSTTFFVYFYFSITVLNIFDCVTRLLSAHLLRPLNVACNAQNRKYHMHDNSMLMRKNGSGEKKVSHLEAKIIKTFPISIQWIICKLELAKLELWGDIFDA